MARPGERIPRTIVKSATIAANGTASVRFDGPDNSFDQYQVQSIQMDSTSATLTSARLYAGDAATGRLIARQDDGQSGAFYGQDGLDLIDSGRFWTLQWTDGTVGATCTASMFAVEKRR